MDEFNPRGAALRYAGATEATPEAVASNSVNAIVCALVYVGDQLAAIEDKLARIDQSIQTIE